MENRIYCNSSSVTHKHIGFRFQHLEKVSKWNQLIIKYPYENNCETVRIFFLIGNYFMFWVVCILVYFSFNCFFLFLKLLWYLSLLSIFWIMFQMLPLFLNFRVVHENKSSLLTSTQFTVRSLSTDKKMQLYASARTVSLVTDYRQWLYWKIVSLSLFFGISHSHSIARFIFRSDWFGTGKGRTGVIVFFFFSKNKVDDCVQ